ncbi:cupin domain-containing protein [Mucilaginibacter paludis]|uniref:Cupin 2 conserved barrel domain protein n=1 Tax=Mucilaginibacter paludis DSM 18603 TaxID=714943 RepID=H1Y4A6_9SPHI|nr:cupin domain-containing protein [Mucilaginibacter paludis]EHQ25740.1 Cupin 2 conserved barrel domain protein [Mucilaginibacter paludis DSM 18603]
MSKAASNIFQFENEIEWEDQGNGIQRQVFGYNDQIMLVKAKFEKGAIGTLHQHPHTQVTYVRGGAFEATIGSEIRVIKDGDGFYVPPNVLHGVVCLEAGTLVDAFTPMRDDFI